MDNTNTAAATEIVTCGCSATQDALAYGVTADAGRCIGCGTPVEAPRVRHAVNYTDRVTEYGITVNNPFKVF